MVNKKRCPGKCVPDWQEKLVTFCKINSQETMVRSTRRGRGSRRGSSQVQVLNTRSSRKGKPTTIDLVEELPATCGSEEIFLLLATVSLSNNSLEPTIIMVDRDNFNEETSVTSKIIKYKYDVTDYAARVLASSTTRSKLVKVYEDLVESKPYLFKDQESKIKPIVYSCTSLVEIKKGLPDEILVIALNHMMRKNDDMNSSNSNRDSDQTSEEIPELTPERVIIDELTDAYNNDSTVMHGDALQQDNMIFSSTPNTSRSINEKPDFDVIINSATITNQEQEGTKKKTENDLQTSKRKKRSSSKKVFCDQEMLARIKNESMERRKDLDASIESSMQFLSQTLPTIKVTKPYQPILSHLFELMKNLNEKMNEQENLKSMSSGYNIIRQIKLQKLEGSKTILIGGRLKVPMSSYAYATDRDKPHLIISRFMRKCIDRTTKIGAELNQEANDSNFAYRLGDSALEGQERVQDGHKFIEMLIEHAHQYLGMNYVTFKEYRECITQVSKALYDVNRKDIARNPKRSSSIHDVSIEYENEKITSAQPSKRSRFIELDGDAQQEKLQEIEKEQEQEQEQEQDQDQDQDRCQVYI